MAEEQAAQKKLGELYVDLGIGGLGRMLRGLNNVSAQFLLTKNAAQQALRPLANMSSRMQKDAVGVEKLANAYGMLPEVWDKVRRWSNKHLIDPNVVKGVVETFENLQNEINLGRFTPTPNMINAGITGDFVRQLQGQENPLVTLDVLGGQLERLLNSTDIGDKTIARKVLEDLNLNAEELMWVFRESGGELARAIDNEASLTKQQIENNVELQKAIAGWQNDLNLWLGQLISDHLPFIKKTGDNLMGWLKSHEKDFANIANGLIDFVKQIAPPLAKLTPPLAKLLPIIADGLTALVEAITGEKINGGKLTYDDAVKNVTNGTATPGEHLVVMNPVQGLAHTLTAPARLYNKIQEGINPMLAAFETRKNYYSKNTPSALQNVGSFIKNTGSLLAGNKVEVKNNIYIDKSIKPDIKVRHDAQSNKNTLVQENRAGM